MLLKKYYLQWLFVGFFSLGLLLVSPAIANSDVDSAEPVNERAKVLSTFLEGDKSGLVESFDERRDQHKILFYMGVVLLIFILLTAGFGVSMAMLGKELFVPHMICAGVSVFLSIAHAVVAMVWFFPF